MKSTKVAHILDPLLLSIIQLADHTPSQETEVILHVDGALITGTIIGTAAYIDLHFKNLNDSVIDADEEHFAIMKRLQKWQHDLVKHESVIVRPAVVLLRNATISGAWGETYLDLWRVPLEAISGWSEGSLAPRSR